VTIVIRTLSVSEVSSLGDDPRVVIYDRHRFIIQATVVLSLLFIKILAYNITYKNNSSTKLEYFDKFFDLWINCRKSLGLFYKTSMTVL
jgi:hypothetical protein